MSETISSLMKELKMSRSGVEMRMSRIPKFRDKYTKRVGKGILISDKGAQVLKSSTHVTSHNTSHVTSDTSVILLKQMLKDRESHIKDLQQQLGRVNDSNKHLGKLLDQQQQLQLTSQHDVERLRGQIKHLKGISGPVVTNTNNSESNVQKSEKGESESNNFKHGFWSKLFGKF